MDSDIYKKINLANEALYNALKHVKSMEVFLTLIKDSIKEYKQNTNIALDLLSKVEDPEEKDKIRGLFRANRKLRDTLFLELMNFNKNIIKDKDF